MTITNADKIRLHKPIQQTERTINAIAMSCGICTEGCICGCQSPGGYFENHSNGERNFPR